MLTLGMSEIGRNIEQMVAFAPGSLCHAKRRRFLMVEEDPSTASHLDESAWRSVISRVL